MSEAAEAFAAFLDAAIEKLSRVTTGETSMSGISRLAQLATTTLADADKKADAVADKLQAAFARHDEVTQAYETYAAQVAEKADAAMQTLRQLSNLAPPENPTKG